MALTRASSMSCGIGILPPRPFFAISPASSAGAAGEQRQVAHVVRRAQPLAQRLGFTLIEGPGEQRKAYGQRRIAFRRLFEIPEVDFFRGRKKPVQQTTSFQYFE